MSASPTEPVLVVGEALIDLINREGGSPDARVGGSPLNVAVGLSRLDVPAVLQTCIGTDSHAALIAAHLDENDVPLAPGSIRGERTSTAVASIGVDGAATYEFDLRWMLDRVQGGSPSLVHTGSIGAVLEPGGSVVLDTIRAHRAAATISYDPNVRPSIMGAVDEVRARIEELVAVSDVVKASEDDVQWLYAGRSLPEVMAAWGRLGPGLVVITRGGDGVTYRVTSTGDVAEEPARVDRVADTVGAGDSFMAGLVSGLLDAGLLGEPAARERLTEATVDDVAGAVSRALATSAVTVGRAGAYAPTRDEITPTGA